MSEIEDLTNVVGDKLKPVRYLAMAAFAAFSTGGTYVWDLSQFIHEEHAHEKQQDKNLLTLKKGIDANGEGIDATRKLNLEVIQLVINNLALLREVQLQTLKPQKRAEMRKQFAVQRAAEIELLVNLKRVD